jgi:preprotein translocase subunit SecD
MLHEALAMRALTIACICGLVVACSGHAERGQPAPDRSGALTNRGRRLQLVYDLDVDKAIDDKASELRRDLEAGLAEQKIVASVSVSAMSLGALTVTPSDGANKPAIERLVKANYGEAFETRTCDASAGPNAICIEITAAYADAVKKTALSNAVATIRGRLVARNVADPTVVEKGGQIVVEFPETDPQGLTIRSLIARAGKLEFKIVDDGSEYMKRLFVHVGSAGARGAATDARAIEEAITAEVDQWRSEDGGPNHTDYYLVAHDREALLPAERARQLGCPATRIENGQVRCTVGGRFVIERYLAELIAKDPARFQVPDDRQIGYELVEPDPRAKDQRPYWRTYYLERAVRLTGSAIANAQASFDPNTNRPIVLLDFNRLGTRVFADLTAQIVGKKLATILDDRVKSAPIINGAIRGGRASITMGGSDPRSQEAERDELVNVLKTGSLPSPLREVSSHVVP